MSQLAFRVRGGGAIITELSANFNKDTTVVLLKTSNSQMEHDQLQQEDKLT